MTVLAHEPFLEDEDVRIQNAASSMFAGQSAKVVRRQMRKRSGRAWRAAPRYDYLLLLSDGSQRWFWDVEIEEVA